MAYRECRISGVPARVFRIGFSGESDGSQGYAVLNSSGASALDVLAQGCGIDLDPSVFIEGACTMTALEFGYRVGDEATDPA